MFKLIKVMNSGINVPEPQILPKAEEEIARGEVLVISGGKATHCPTTTKPTHIALATAKAKDENSVCAMISPDMIFECPITEGTPSTLTVGTKVCLTQKNGQTAGVNTTTTSGVATIYDTLGANKIGDTVLITFR